MTIGVGLLCSDGIVLCSDRQLTGSGGYKFEELKIFKSQVGDYVLAFSYAGDPDAAKVMFTKVKETVKQEICGAQKSGDVFTKDKARTVLEKTFKDANAKNLQTLIGISTNGQHFLLKTVGKRVVIGTTEYIGIGDSSALRYLCEFLLESFPTVHEAQILGSYIVSVANRYMDGCGGGPDFLLLNSDGKLGEGSGGPWPNQRERNSYCEQEMGKGMRALLFSGGTKCLLVVDPKQLISQK